MSLTSRSSGLHLTDVEQLPGLLDRLVDSGKSVIVIEHHQAVNAHTGVDRRPRPRCGHDGGRRAHRLTASSGCATLTGEHLAGYVGT